MCEIITTIKNDINFRKSNYNSLLFSYKKVQLVIEEAKLLISSGVDLTLAAPFQLITIDSDELKSLHDALQLKKDQIQMMLKENINMIENVVKLMGFFHSGIAFYNTVGTNIVAVADGDEETLKNRINQFCKTLELNEKELEETTKILENLSNSNDNNNLLDNFVELLKTEENKNLKIKIEEEKLKISNNNKEVNEFNDDIR